jgi:hypothetical protein
MLTPARLQYSAPGRSTVTRGSSATVIPSAARNLSLFEEEILRFAQDDRRGKIDRAA